MGGVSSPIPSPVADTISAPISRRRYAEQITGPPLYDADKAPTSELMGKGHTFNSSILSPQYQRNADGSYTDVGANPAVDTFDGEKWLRSCGAVTNLLTNSKFEGGISGSASVPASAPTGWSLSVSENYVATYTGDLLSLTVTNGKYQLYQAMTFQPYTTYRYSSHLISDGVLRIPDYLYRTNAPVGLTETFECDGIPVGINYVPPSGPHQATIVFTTAENGGSIILRYGIGTVYAVTGSGVLSRPQLTATPYQQPYVPTTPSGPVTQPASNATTTNGCWFTLADGSPVWKALDGDVDGVELSSGHLDEWTPYSCIITGDTFVSTGTGQGPILGPFEVGTRYRINVLGSVVGTTFGINSANSTAPSARTEIKPGFGSVTWTVTAEQPYIYLRNATAGTTTIASISIQRIQPQPLTLATRVRMGVGSGELPVSATFCPILSEEANSELSVQRYYKDPIHTTVVSSKDSVTAYIDAPWPRNSIIRRITQVNTAGTQFRVGYMIEGTHTEIQWSSWTAFDGSFDPSTLYKLMLGYNNPYPMWYNKIAVWNKQMDDAAILEALA